MGALLLSLSVFLAGYLINTFYISVLYHRGLTHGALTLSPWARWLVVRTGNWVTGLDPKGWATMHRLHHEHSDTERDPHSPVNLGTFGLALGQLRAYEKTLRGLARRQEPYASISRDLDFGVNWLNRNRLWYLPYMLHGALALVLALASGIWHLGAAYWLGIMSHPIQGWMVNSLAHQYGYRNFSTQDRSANNWIVALLVAGEGYQNNHHERPRSAKFSARWFEVDWGYAMCRFTVAIGLAVEPAFREGVKQSSGFAPESATALKTSVFSSKTTFKKYI